MCLVVETMSRSLCPEPPPGHCPGSWHNAGARPAPRESTLEKDKAAVALSSWPAAVTQVCAQPCLPCLPRPALRNHRACVSTSLADKDHAACQGPTWDLLIWASLFPFPTKGSYSRVEGVHEKGWPPSTVQMGVRTQGARAQPLGGGHSGHD